MERASGSSFDSEQQRRYSRIHYRKSQRFSSSDMIMDDKKTQIGQKEKEIFKLIEKLRSKIAKISIHNQKDCKALERKFIGIMGMISSSSVEVNDRIIPYSTIKQLVHHFLNFYLQSILCKDLFQEFDDTGLSIPEILPFRDKIVQHVISHFTSSICWDKKYISYIVLPVEKRVVAPSSKTIRAAYQSKYEEEDKKLCEKLQEFATIMPAHLSIPEHLWLLPKREGNLKHVGDLASFLPPYYSAIQKLKEMELKTTPWEKLVLLKHTVRAIHTCVLEHNTLLFQMNSLDFQPIVIGAEQLVPLFIYIVVQSRLNFLASEYHFLEDFIREEQYDREMGYYLVTLQIVINSILNLTYEQIVESGKLCYLGTKT